MFENWYWRGNLGVYGSARGSLVADPVTDEALRAWTHDGSRNPTSWPKDESGIQTTAALDAVLAAFGLPLTGLTPLTKNDLVTYANAHQWSLAIGGYTIEGRLWATDVVSHGLITGKSVRLLQPGAPSSIRWQTSMGFETIQTADFLAAAVEIADFVQATFDALNLIVNAIEDGAITTYAEIDKASWPSATLS